MKKIQKIFYLVFVFVALFTIVACRNKNKGSVKEYTYNYDISYSEEGYNLEQLIAQIESANNVSFNGASFNIVNNNSEVVECIDGNLTTKNTGVSQLVLTNEGNKITVNVNVKPTMNVLASYEMKQGNSQSISVKFKPESAKESYEITSSNPDVVAVGNKNIIRAVSTGVAEITVTSASGLVEKFEITVDEIIYKITYEVNDENLEFMVPSFEELPKEYKSSELPLKLPVIERPGYAFFGWQINPIGEDFTIENLVTSVPANTKGNITVRPIVLRSRLELRLGETSVIKPNESIKIFSEVFNVPADKQEIVWESKNDHIATVDKEGNVTGVSDGIAEIFAYLKDMPDVNMTVYVSVDANLNNHSTLLDYLQSIAIEEIVTKRITVIAYQGNYTTYMYSGVSLFLFEDLKIVEQITSASMSNRPGDIYEKHYVTVHDTASGAEGANAKSHANYVNEGGGGTSWHYSVGNDGIYHQIPDNERAFHAGDGTRPYKLTASGVKGTNKYPEVTISADGYYELDGQKTKVKAPTKEVGGKTVNTTTEDINDFGIRVVLQDGEYYIGVTYFNDTYDKISNGGGNCNAIGIEMCVNKGSDIFYTWQKNAKLVAKLLYDNSLTIDDVKPHHFFSGKDCPASMLHAEMWDMFIDMVEVEYKIRTEYAGYKISITSSDPSFVGNNGKVLKQAPLSRSVSYTITVEKDGISESITLSTVIPGRLSLTNN